MNPNAHSFLLHLFLLLLALFIPWLLSVIVFRDHPWAMAGWIPATGIAGLITLILPFLLFDSLSNTSGGAANGFAALGAMIAMTFLMPFPLFLGLSLYVRPRKPGSEWAGIVGLIIMFIAASLLYFQLHPR